MNALLGLWLFTSIIYNGQTQPRPNPNLIMTLNFVSESQNILKYSRENEPGFCERTAEYVWNDGLLIQKVIAVHPENASFCLQDPDMVLGTESATPLEQTSDALLMTLGLGDETLTYIWTRTKGSSDEN